MQFFNFNGKIYAEDTAIISSNNRGLRYGDGLFETIKIKNGNIIFANDHFARLWKGMQTLQFEIPKHFSPEKLQEEMVMLAKKNAHQNAARVRLTIYRGKGGLYDAENNLPNYFIETWELQKDSGQLNSNGLDVIIYTEAKKNCDVLSNLKHNNYLPYVMAAIFAKKNKCNDAILLNNFGKICDSTIANIFLMKDNTVYTPALSQGCVAGVMRKYILEQVKINGFACIEKEITIEELLNADEVFLTNAIYNIRWVKCINQKTYTNSIIQKIYSNLSPTIL